MRSRWLNLLAWALVVLCWSAGLARVAQAQQVGTTELWVSGASGEGTQNKGDKSAMPVEEAPVNEVPVNEFRRSEALARTADGLYSGAVALAALVVGMGLAALGLARRRKSWRITVVLMFASALVVAAAPYGSVRAGEESEEPIVEESVEGEDAGGTAGREQELFEDSFGGNVPSDSDSQTITLDPNGAPGDPVLLETRGVVVAPSCPFSYDRHEFRGWGLAPNDDAPFVEGTDVPAPDGSTLFAQWSLAMPDGLQRSDFASKRLIVGMEETPPSGTVVSSHDGVWLVEYETLQDAAWAFVDLAVTADFVAPDVAVSVAEPYGTTALLAPAADLGVLNEEACTYPGAVALVDTGVTGYSENVLERTSVLGSTFIDDHGHGTEMARLMVGVDPKVRIVSIKAADEWGYASAASVYVAIHQAIDMRAKVINLSLCSSAVEGNAAVEQAICDAHAAGVIVVGAAGNEGRNAKWYVPGRMEDEAVVVGSCDPSGVRNSSSNFGETVDLLIPSSSTSGAAAKVSAWLYAHGSFGEELAALLSAEARKALGFLEGEPSPNAAGDDRPTNDAPPEYRDDDDLAVAAGGSLLKVRVAYKDHMNIENETWRFDDGPECGDNNGNMYLGLCLLLDNLEGVDGGVSYEAWVQGTGPTGVKRDGELCGTPSSHRSLEDVRIWLTGTIAQCYYVKYSCTLSRGMEYDVLNPVNGSFNVNHSCTGSPFFGNTYETVEQGAWTHIDKHAAFTQTVVDSKGVTRTQSVAQNELSGGGCGVRRLNTSLETVPHRHRVLARYQNADGTFGEPVVEFDSMINYLGRFFRWKRAADDTYLYATVAPYNGTYYDKDNYVDIKRKTHALSFELRNEQGGTVAYDAANPLVSFEMSLDDGGSWEDGQEALERGLTMYHGQTLRIRNLRAASGHVVSNVEGMQSEQDGVYGTCVEDDVTVVVHTCEATENTLSFDANLEGATGEMDQVLVENGQSVLIPDSSFAHALYEFAGWNTRADGSGRWLVSGDEVSDLFDGETEVTLYAQWNARQLRVEVPCAMCFIVTDDGVAIGPPDGCASVYNRGETDVQVDEALVEVFEPYDADLRFGLDRLRMGPQERAELKDVGGVVRDYLPFEKEIGCIHWAFSAVA